MTRIPPLTAREGLSDAQMAVFDTITGNRGAVNGPFAALLHRPEIASPVQELGAYLRFGSAIPPALRESVILVTASLWECDYEWQAHRRIATEVGVEAATIDLISRAEVDAVTGDVGLALRMAVSLINDGRIPDDMFAAASERWTPAELVDLVGLVSYYSLLAMTINAFGIKPR
jgi:4-carboxymuconolactone decarboxylase